MTHVVVKRPRAKRDLLDHFEYIGRDSLRSAERFLDAAEAAFEQLADMPGLGHRWFSDDIRLAGVRVYSIPRFRKYLIFYRPIEGGIEVLHVFHGARDIKGILDNEADDA